MRECWRTFSWLLLLGVAARLEAADAGLVKVKGAIGPATVTYIERALKLGAEQQLACVIITLDTPGGLLDSTKDIVQSFYNARVPVVVYVGPPGATATSAGCFITMAADIAAMAPNTSIGAAHPVSLGPGGAATTDDVMKQKLESFASSYIESIAQKRGRNAAWAISSVRESASITSEKALELKVVDLLATDVQDLLKKIDGRAVGDRVLNTAGAKVRDIPMVARERLFQLLWRPEVMLILMLAAIYGIIGELSNPGAILPGVVGGIALILSLYLAAVLPINIAGLALIGLALALFVGDIFAATHGVLTVGGIISFFLGGLMLFDRADPAFRLSLGYLIPATLITAGFFAFVAGAGMRAQRLPLRVGKETMMGKTVEALTPIDQASGKVFIEGEYWNAVSDSSIGRGEPVEVIGITGLTLKVRRAGSATS
jgi:membrane-bound serine protease (ClpP class)